MTWQLAFKPHTPGHGSMHLLFTHALSREHSELIVHSGLHAGGVPTYSCKHEHTAC